MHFILSNKLSMFCSKGKDIDDFKEKVNQILSAECSRFNVERHLPDLYLVNNMIDDPEVVSIWKGIVRCVHHQSQWERKIQASWITLERDILKKKSEGFNTLTIAEICKMGKQLQIPIVDKEEIHMFLRYLTATGIILYVEEKGETPQEDVAINLQWLIDAFRSIISFEKEEGPETNKSSILKNIRAFGYFTKDMVHALWTEEKFKEKASILLGFMKYLDLIAQPIEGEETYYVPCLFRDKKSDEIRDLVTRQKPKTVSKALCLDYRRERSFMPPTLFDRILAAFIDKYQFLLHGESKIPFYGRGIAFCKVDNEHNALIVCKDDMIKITLLTSLSEVKPGIGGEVRTFFTTTIPRKARLLGQRTQVAKVGIDHDPVPERDKPYYLINDSEIGLDIEGITVKDRQTWELQVHLNSLRGHSDKRLCNIQLFYYHAGNSQIFVPR